MTVSSRGLAALGPWPLSLAQASHAYGQDDGERRDEGRELVSIALSSLSFLKPLERKELSGYLRSLGDLCKMGLGDIETRIGRRLRTLEYEPRRLADETRRRYDFIRSRGIKTLAIDSPDYPPQLREMHDPPFLLYWRGERLHPEYPSLAIVGTRSPSLKAYGDARRIAYELAQASIPVISGLALGVDRAAHEGALEGGGQTIAVLGTGIDTVYPRANQGLAARILANGGAIVSEYPPGWGAMAYRFPQRNRIISGLARAVLVAQAPSRSGALITADYALEQGRELFVMESGLFGQCGQGGARLAAEGSVAVDRANDMVVDWPRINKGMEKP